MLRMSYRRGRQDDLDRSDQRNLWSSVAVSLVEGFVDASQCGEDFFLE